MHRQCQQLEDDHSASKCISGRTLNLQQPRGGLPGLSDQQELEVALPLCGLNDTPKRWFSMFTSELEQLGWTPSALDERVHRFYDPDTLELAGVLCVHVDDVVTGGVGAAFRRSN